jgi:hypothetical protein
MGPKYFQEKAAFCLRVADRLSLDNPGRNELIELAADFKKRAKRLETIIAVTQTP